MGLFNFIYKLTNILSNKRKIKVFVIIGIIIFLLFCWSRGAFAATNDAYITDYQLLMQRQLITYLRYWYNEKNNYDANTFFNICNSLKWMSVYVVTPTGDPNTEMWVYFYTPNSTSFQNSPQNFTIDGTWSVGLNSGVSYDVKLGDMTSRAFLKISIGNPLNYSFEVSVDSFLMPSACYMVRSIDIDNFLIDFGYSVNPDLHTTYNTNDAELQALTQAGFTNQVNAINNATSAINDVNSSVEDVNDSVMQMIEEITSPYVNVSQQQLPTQEVTDGTAEPLNTLFDYIRNAFTGEPTGFSLPLPFVRW